MTQQALTIRQDQTPTTTELATKDILAYLRRTQGHHEARAQWGVELYLVAKSRNFGEAQGDAPLHNLPGSSTPPRPRPIPEDFRIVHTQPVPEAYLASVRLDMCAPRLLSRLMSFISSQLSDQVLRHARWQPLDYLPRGDVQQALRGVADFQSMLWTVCQSTAFVLPQQ